MHEKKGFTKRAEEFLNGKGFYIVLFACVAVIGVSAWLLLFSEYSPLSLGGEEEDYLDAMAPSEETSNPVDLREDQELELGDDSQPQSGGETQIEGQDKESGETIPDHQAEDALTVVESGGEPAPAESEEPAEPSDTAQEPSPEEAAAQSGPTAEDLNFIWPIIGEVTVLHSPESLIYDETMGDWRTHQGIDIAAQKGTKVTAACAGTVTDIYEDDMYGTTVKIDHGAGVVSIYSNLASVPTVVVGDNVTEGAVIGSVGDTALAETADADHLHLAFTVDGVFVDPLDLLPA